MSELKKLIEELSKDIIDFHKFGNDEFEYDYVHVKIGTMRKVIRMLERQEAKCLSKTSLEHLEYNAVVWLEDIDKEDVIPGIFGRMIGEGNKFALFTTMREKMLYADKTEYGIRWRCWNHKPSKEQREEVKWNEAC